MRVGEEEIFQVSQTDSISLSLDVALRPPGSVRNVGQGWPRKLQGTSSQQFTWPRANFRQPLCFFRLARDATLPLPPRASCARRSPAMAKIEFPPGWSSERLNTISAEDFAQVPEDVSPSSRASPQSWTSIMLVINHPKLRTDSDCGTCTGARSLEAGSEATCLFPRVRKAAEAQQSPAGGPREAAYAALVCAPWVDRRAGEGSGHEAR